MRAKNYPIAVVTSDIHLSHLSPVCRAERGNAWYEVMDNYLEQLCRISEEYSPDVSPLPVIIAGDIFDKWNSPAELINFAMKRLPAKCYAIPGQHDLPGHNLEDIKKSAYWTLVESGSLINMEHRIPTIIDQNLIAWPFPWECMITPLNPEQKTPGYVHLAVVHKFIWSKGYGYAGVGKDCMSSVLKKAIFRGYDAVVAGDNHKGFTDATSKGPTLFNCGGFIRRAVNQMHYKPSVGLLCRNGDFNRVYLDSSRDKIIASLEEEDDSQKLDMEGIIDLLNETQHTGLDFRTAVRTMLREKKKDLSKFCLEILNQMTEELF